VSQEATERVDPENEAHGVLFGEHIVRYHFASGLVAGKRVLDAGCGDGYGVALFCRVGAAVAMGVDIATGVMVRAAQRYGDGDALFCAANATHLPFGDASFDIITCFEVLEHLPEAAQRHLIAELRRVLVADGTLIISTPNTDVYTPPISAEVLGANPFHLHEMSPAGFREMLTQSFNYIVVVGQNPVPNVRVSTRSDARPDSTRYHAIGRHVYGVRVTNGEIISQGKLVEAPDPAFSLYLIALCNPLTSPALPKLVGRAKISSSSIELLVYSLWARWSAHNAATQQETANMIMAQQHTIDEQQARELLVYSLWARWSAHNASTQQETANMIMAQQHTIDEQQARMQFLANRLTMTHEAFARTHEALTCTIASRDAAIAQATEQQRLLQGRVKELSDTQRQQNAHIAAQARMIEELNRLYDEHVQVIGEQREHAERTEAHIAAQARMIEELNRLYDEHMQVIGEQREHAERTEAHIAAQLAYIGDLQHNAENLQYLYDAMTRNIATFEAEKSTLIHGVDEAARTHEDDNRRLSDWQERHNAQEQHVAVLRERIAVLEREVTYERTLPQTLRRLIPAPLVSVFVALRAGERTQNR